MSTAPLHWLCLFSTPHHGGPTNRHPTMFAGLDLPPAPQYEHTLYLHPTRKEVLSRGSDY